MVRLWIRADGGEPKAIGQDLAAGPGPGEVVDVSARSAREARSLYATACQAEPDELKDPEGWLAWRKACRAVRKVTA